MKLKKILASIYKWVQEMPFETNLTNGQNYHEKIKYILINKRGSCSPKHYLLGSVYENLNIQLLFLTHPFYWHDLEVDYSRHIKKLAAKMPISYHLALQIGLEGENILIDATWDSPLEKAGFNVNHIKEEIQNTHLAVKPCESCIVHATAAERDNFIRRLKSQRIFDPQVAQDFYNALNVWMNSLRK